MSKIKILVVEDSRTQLEIYKDILGKEGYEVFEAMDGKEGLKKAMSEKPDVIITDLDMPGMNGFEMVKALKKDDNMKYVPVICASATHISKQDRLQGLLEAGAEEYFYLPNDMDELIAKVEVMKRIRGIYLDLLEKNKQLSIFNSAATGREMKMIELKEKVKELEKELAKYKK